MFIRERRKEHKLSLRKFANLVGISPAYLSSIESGCRTAPTEKVLAKMSEVLMLSDKEKTFMSDLAASSKKKGMVATDIADYISKNKYVSNAIRTAINLHIDKDDWENFIGLMEKKVFEIRVENSYSTFGLCTFKVHSFCFSLLLNEIGQEKHKIYYSMIYTLIMFDVHNFVCAFWYINHNF